MSTVDKVSLVGDKEDKLDRLAIEFGFVLYERKFQKNVAKSMS